MQRSKHHRLTPQLTGMPSGTEVTVLLDNGTKWETRTRSEPWQLGDGTWVVLLDGKSGGYDLSRVQPLTSRAERTGDT